jgi:tetratricopeptide (TPR) repeat protein
MSRAVPSLLVLAVLSLRLPPVAAAEPTEEDVARAVKQLGDDSFAVREKASAELLKIGWAAKPALRRALQSEDKETARRASELLGKLRQSVPPGTPREIAELVAEYYAEKKAWDKRTVVGKLLGKGTAAYSVVADLDAEEDDPDVRHECFRFGDYHLRRFAIGLIGEGRAAEAEGWLLRVLAIPENDRYHREDPAADYAALLLLLPRPEEQAARLQARAEKEDKTAAAVLAYLYRGLGRASAARKAAEKAGRPELLELLLVEQKEWAALAEKRLPVKDQKDRNYVLLRWGLRAAYLRLAGKEEAFTKAIDEVRKNSVPELDEQRRSLPAAGAATLLLNDRPADALALLREHKDVVRQFELLCAQGRFREAFALEAKDPEPDSRNMSWLDLSRSRALMRLGERKQAVELMEKTFRGLKGTIDPRRYWEFLEVEASMGLREEAIEHCLRVFANWDEINKSAKDRNWALHSRDWLAAAAFGEGGPVQPEVWWTFFALKETEAVAFQKTRDLLDGKVRGKEAEALFKAMEKASQSEQRRRGNPSDWENLGVLAEAALAVGRRDLARSYWEKAAADKDRLPPKPLLRLADLAAEEKRWEEAETFYRRAWERDTTDAVAYYRSGWALKQSDKGEEGERRMRRASDLPLGRLEPRLALASELLGRGRREEAQREMERCLRLGGPEASTGLRDALTFLGRAAERQGDFAAAAAYHERVRLFALSYNRGQIRTGVYLILPHRVHRVLARAHLAAGRTEEARKEIRYCLELLPANLDLPLALVPALEARGLDKDAEELFRSVHRRYEETTADHPRCAWAHHQLAWLCVRCGRRLDEALEHAARAVELEPANAVYRDTLAEVCFQKGDKAEAIRLIKQCQEREPGTAYYAQQLKRFEAGDRKAALPAEVASLAKTEEACLLNKDLLYDGPIIAGPGAFGGSGSVNNWSNGSDP